MLLNVTLRTGPLEATCDAIVRHDAGLVQQMLTHAGKGRYDMRSKNPSALIREMSGVLNALVAKGTTIHLALEQDLPPFKADVTQVRQLVMNRVLNASESLEGNAGPITLRTSVTDVAENTHRSVLSNLPLRVGCYVVIEVEDTGCGMTPETIAKMIDPFFTTKFTGRGLGLAAAVGIVQTHGGTMKVHSELDKGTSFKILLPCDKTAGVAWTASARALDEWRGHPTFLLADDDDRVRSLATRYLQRLGFDVLTASDGKEAVRLFHRHRQVIVAVLMDVAMPGMGGLEATQALRATDAKIPVVLMSGHSVENVTAHLTSLKVSDFIHKPFDVSTFKKSIRKALEGNSREG